MVRICKLIGYNLFCFMIGIHHQEAQTPMPEIHTHEIHIIVAETAIQGVIAIQEILMRDLQIHMPATDNRRTIMLHRTAHLKLKGIFMSVSLTSVFWLIYRLNQVCQKSSHFWHAVMNRRQGRFQRFTI